MRYIEPHGHMVSRTTDDYLSMVTAGCEAVCEPAFWAGFDRKSVDGFYDYFCQLTEHEPRRALNNLQIVHRRIGVSFEPLPVAPRLIPRVRDRDDGLRVDVCAHNLGKVQL